MIQFQSNKNTAVAYQQLATDPEEEHPAYYSQKDANNSRCLPIKMLGEEGLIRRVYQPILDKVYNLVCPEGFCNRELGFAVANLSLLWIFTSYIVLVMDTLVYNITISLQEIYVFALCDLIIGCSNIASVWVMIRLRYHQSEVPLRLIVSTCLLQVIVEFCKFNHSEGIIYALVASTKPLN